MKKNPKTNTTKAYPKEIKDSKKAILHYEVVKQLKTYSHLEVVLETGRSHQIRSQLAYIGSPIKGDLKYGYSRSNNDGSINLHSRKVQFIHPVSKKNIEIGKRNFGKVSINSGVSEGDKVISEGVSKVRNKIKVKILNSND